MVTVYHFTMWFEYANNSNVCIFNYIPYCKKIYNACIDMVQSGDNEKIF